MPKCNVTRRAPPSDIRSTPAGILLQPQNWGAQKVQVLRIPADGSLPVMIHLNTIKTDSSRPLDQDTAEETVRSERWVEHVPDIRGYKDAEFDWDFRTLIAANITAGVPEECKGGWFMYMCNIPAGGLPWIKNPYFAEDKKVRACGDVFVFKSVGERFDQLGRMNYVKKWSIPKDNKVARDIFVSLALASRGVGRRTVVDCHAETSVAVLGDQQ